MNYKRYREKVIDVNLKIANRYIEADMQESAIMVLKSLVEDIALILKCYDTGEEDE